MKGYKTASALLLLICLCAFFARGAENVDSYAAESFDTSGVWASLSDEAKGLLEDVGITSAEYGDLFNVSGKRIIDALLNAVREKAVAPVRTFLSVTGILLLSAAAGAFLPEKGSGVFSYTAYAASALAVIIPVSSLVTLVASSVNAAYNLEKAFLPLLTALIAVSGKPVTSSAYSSAMYVFGSFIVYAAKYLLTPLCAVMICVAAVSGIYPGFDAERTVSPLKKAVTLSAGALATLFSGAVGLKGTLASSADSLASRGVKFLVGSGVPVVGGAISEAYSSVLASLGLIKSTVGVFGIAGMCAVFATPMISLALWSITLGFLGYISVLFGCEREGALFRSLCGTVSLLFTLCALTLLVFCVTAGAVLRVSAV